MTMAAIAELFEILGLALKTAKSEIGTHITFLGLAASFPAPTNQMTLTLSLSPEKAKRWASLIDYFLQEGAITHAALESLIGKLGFAQSAVFGKFARAMLKPLYIKLYAQRYLPALTPALIRNLRWWRTTLKNILPMTVSPNRSRPDWVLYTDAAFDGGADGARIAAIFLLGF